MSQVSSEIYLSTSEEKTFQHGKTWAKKIRKLPHLILLEGPVGAGKTSWIRGFVAGYLKKSDRVTSPTYSLVNQYSDGKKQVIHGDFYRIQNLDDLESIGFWDFLNKKNVILVEWGGLVPSYTWPKNLPVDLIQIEIEDESNRKIEIKRHA